jgi:hypothetical protein
MPLQIHKILYISGLKNFDPLNASCFFNVSPFNASQKIVIICINLMNFAA